MIRRHKVRRLATLEDETLGFMVFLGSRSRGWKSFTPEEVPEFEGNEASFEVDITKGDWTLVRLVESPRQMSHT